MPDALTLSDVAARLKCCTKTVRQLADSGRLRPCVLGGVTRKHRRFTPEEVERFLSTESAGAVPVARPRRLPPVPRYV